MWLDTSGFQSEIKTFGCLHSDSGRLTVHHLHSDGWLTVHHASPTSTPAHHAPWDLWYIIWYLYESYRGGSSKWLECVQRWALTHNCDASTLLISSWSQHLSAIKKHTQYCWIPSTPIFWLCPPQHPPALVWTTMVSLCHIDPPGKFESTIRGLKMHFIHNWLACIITQDVQLGWDACQLSERTNTTQPCCKCCHTQPPASSSCGCPTTTPPHTLVAEYCSCCPLDGIEHMRRTIHNTDVEMASSS